MNGPIGVLYEEEFFKGIHDAIMHLDGYRQTPHGGIYFLRVFDENENMIFENEMTFAEPSLEIDDVDLLWWEEGDTLALVGAQVTAVNRGDLPVYPYEIVVDLGAFEETGNTLPMVVLPNQEKLVNACMYRSGVSAASRITETSVRSSDNEGLGQFSEDVKPEENVDELVFSWRYQGSQVMRVPELEFLYDYYVGLDRFLSEDYAAYIFDVYDDPYIELLAAELLERTTMVDVVGRINFIASYFPN